MNIAIITGASSGMGKCFALYAKEYFNEIDEIWLIGRDIKRLKDVSEMISCKSEYFSLDLTNDQDIRKLVNELNVKRPNIRLLVNSAGMGIIGEFTALKYNDIHNMIATNCQALTEVTGVCLNYMGRGSRIINLSSSAAFVPQAGFAVYAASKSYVLSFSDALGRELKKKEITVTAVCPGTVKTPFIKKAEKYRKIKTFKKFFMSDENKVVKKALKDSLNGKTRSVYGFCMNVFQIICKILPSKFILLFMK